ncbi:hypothetical protein JTB14_035889 [Gonioctena quinquepunctata]|nr:hypothetical protein JTB14_035889 [Gonioctena quinquepunctata]
MFHVCCVYLPPKDDYARVCFTSKLNNIKDAIPDDPILIYGHFNIPHNEWVRVKENNFVRPSNVDEKNANLVDLLTSSEFVQYNFIHNSNNRLLDLILYKRIMMFIIST